MTGLSNLYATWRNRQAQLWRKFFRVANRMLVEKSFARAVMVLVLLTFVASELLVYIWWRVLIGAIEPEIFLITGMVTSSVSVPFMSYCVWIVKRANQNYRSLKKARQDLDEYVVKLEREFQNRARAEEAMRAAKEHAEYASRSKSEFLANMSHELRTPLNAIIGFSELMARETFGSLGNDKYRDYARDINESGAHLLSLINDILDLAKIEARKLKLDEKPVDLGAAVSSCLRLVKERAKEHKVRLVNRVDPGLASLRADERAVKQIVLNLLSNAVKFTPEGGRITVEAGIDGDALRLAVRDTGIGIAADDIPKIMEPFRQVDGSLARTYEGTGLGLPLVKSLVELHGGTLTLESEVGVGTVATARFPASRIVGDEVKERPRPYHRPVNS